jgi:hypothetical protein
MLELPEASFQTPALSSFYFQKPECSAKNREAHDSETCNLCALDAKHDLHPLVHVEARRNHRHHLHISYS